MNSYPYTKRDKPVFYHTVDSMWAGVGGDEHPQHTVTQIIVDDYVNLGRSPDNWKQIKASGGQAGSVLDGVRHGGYSKAGLMSYYYPDPRYSLQKGYADGAISGIPLFPAPLTSLNTQADIAARKQFLDKALAARKSWRGGNFLAEFAETVHMLKHPLKGLAENLGAFAKGVKSLRGYWLKGEVEAYGRHLGNLWLEYSFGWKPLFEDIKDANSALEKLADSHRCDTKRLSATGVFRSYTNTGEQSAFLPGGLPGLCGQMTFNKSSQYVKYYGTLKARPVNITTVLDNFGFTPGDILPAVWEAIPWSFFVDYFVNVQELLDSMQFALGDFGWLMQGVRNVSANYALPPYVYPGVAAATGYVIQCGGGGACSSTTYVRRLPQLEPPMPSFNFRCPGLGSLKWVNIAALAAQFSGSSPGRGPKG